MEHIKAAIERARADRAIAKPGTGQSRRAQTASAQGTDPGTTSGPQLQPREGGGASPARDKRIGRLVAVNTGALEDHRIFAFNSGDPRAGYFDMLRTQVLQLMDLKGWKKVAISSPTPGCGKSVVSINLALSVARLPERSAVLVDLDLRKPQVANYLGLPSQKGITTLLRSGGTIEDALVRPQLGQCSLLLLAEDGPIPHSTEELASTRMKSLISSLAASDPDSILIFDLPPVLTSDDCLAFVPQVDCVLLIVAVGQSTVDQIAKCETMLSKANLIGVVLNKASESDSDQTSYY